MYTRIHSFVSILSISLLSLSLLPLPILAAEDQAVSLSPLINYIDFNSLANYLSYHGPNQAYRRGIEYVQSDLLLSDVVLSYSLPSLNTKSHSPNYIHLPESLSTDSYSFSYADLVKISSIQGLNIQILSDSSNSIYVSPIIYDYFMPFISFNNKAWATFDRTEIISIDYTSGDVSIYNMSDYGVIGFYFCDGEVFYLICVYNDTYNYIDMAGCEPIFVCSYTTKDPITVKYPRKEGFHIIDGTRIITMKDKIIIHETENPDLIWSKMFLREINGKVKALMYTPFMCLELTYSDGEWREDRYYYPHEGYWGNCYLWKNGIISYDAVNGIVKYIDINGKLVKAISIGMFDYLTEVAAFDLNGNGIVTDIKELMLIRYNSDKILRYDLEAIPFSLYERADQVYLIMNDGEYICLEPKKR